MQAYDLGMILRVLRENKNLSQHEVAKSTGISRTALSNYESNLNVPSSDIIRTLCRFYNVSADFLLGLESKISFNFDDFSPEQKDYVTEVINLLIMNLKKGFLQ